MRDSNGDDNDTSKKDQDTGTSRSTSTDYSNAPNGHTKTNDFLSQLRASTVTMANDDTLSAGNTEKHRRGLSNLSDLFDPFPDSNDGSANKYATFEEPPSPLGNRLPPPKIAPVPAPTLAALPPRPQALHQHNRQVSWGNNINFEPPLTANYANANPLIRQPSLEDNGYLSSMDGTESDHVTEKKPPQQRARLFSLDTVLQAGPFEEEAETYILKALEEHENQQPFRQRSDTATSTILSQVPESTSHDFSLSPESDVIDYTPSNDSSGGNTPPRSDHSPRTGSSSSPRNSPIPATRPRLSSTASIASGRSRSSIFQHEHKPLLPGSAPRPAQRHRRDASVEQTLFGLTSALTALHEEDPKSYQQGNHPLTASMIAADNRMASSSESLLDEIQQPSSSADQFAQNAVLLSRVNEESNAAASKSASKTSKDRWNKLRDNLRTVPEGDGSRPESLGDSEHNSVVPGATATGSTTAPSDVENDLSARDDNDNNNNGGLPPSGASVRQSKTHKGSRRKSVIAHANDKLKEDVELWQDFFRPRKDSVWSYIKTVLLYLMLPATGIAMILYYFCENPPTGKGGESADVNNPEGKASVSWWLVFMCVRQVITFSLALGMQGILIDFLCLGSRVMLRLAGPLLTLMIVQSKGWPHVAFWWAIFDFTMLHGDGAFAKHWAFWQEWIDVFNENNPSGHIVDNEWNTRILTITICVSVVASMKRFVIGLYLGRQTFSHFGDQLARVMNKMLLVSEVAGLAKDIERSHISMKVTMPVPSECFGRSRESCVAHERQDASIDDDTDGDTTNTPRSKRSAATSERVIDTTARDPLTGSLHQSERIKIMQLLEQWEEPSRRFHQSHSGTASISAVLQFRKALTFIQKRYPFSFAFGPAYSRTACIDSAQIVYTRLLMRKPSEPVLQFETIALLALDEHGQIDQNKAKDLVKLFRPDRQGNLVMLDFVKSVDAVYKEFRFLNASIENSSRIDRAFEAIFNIVFYAIVVTLLLSQMGFDPLALFLSLSSVILAFAFMIGSASAKYFEGLLFILIRRPYGIGDRIHISNVEHDTNFDGSAGWVVENVTLFETTAIWTPTKEHCSLSNGSLANSRIINGARSPQAQVHIFLKLPIDVPYEKILIFKSAVEEYLKARPREWLSLNGFRAKKIMADQGFIEYDVIVQHREAWQQVGQILDSKANLSSYCQEVVKQLNVHYRAPPLPVDLRYTSADIPVPQGSAHENMDQEARAGEFRSLALSMFNINTRA